MAAEVAVTALGVLQFITPLLIEKLNLQMDVKGEIKTMQSWLTTMQAYKEDNSGHQHSKTLVDVDVLRKVGEITFDIEDVFDEFNRLSLLHKFHDKIVLRDIYQRGLKEKTRRIKEGIKTLTEQKAFAANSSSSSSTLFSVPINSSLLRSYMDLPRRLKCCFLYMSIFPEDRPVEHGRLTRLWVAEGFAEATDSRTAEEVAECYLNQLVGRNLILVSNSDFCSLSNLTLNFAVQKSKDESFASVFAQTQKTKEDQRRRHRRLSFHEHCRLLFPRSEGDFDTVHSMFLFRSKEEETEPSNSDFKENLRMLKLIKVLDVQGANLTKFYKKITRLVLLRYLSFRDTKIESIPTSINKLSNLETLDLSRTQVAELPRQISNLHNLRHLLASKYDVSAFDSVQGVELPEGISRLTNLQTLSLVKVDPSGRVLKDLKALTQLKKLGLTHLRREHGKDLCAALESMKTLRTLDITSDSKEELIELQKMENQPKSLQRLYLKGRLEKIPAWMSKLDGVVRIELKWCGLRSSPLEALKSLRNLRELQLVDCFSGEELRFEGEGFEKLETIVMEDFANLKRLKVGGGAAPGLKKISVRRCSQLRMPFRVSRLVEVETEEDIEGRDYSYCMGCMQFIFFRVWKFT